MFYVKGDTFFSWKKLISYSIGMLGNSVFENALVKRLLCDGGNLFRLAMDY